MSVIQKLSDNFENKETHSAVMRIVEKMRDVASFLKKSPDDHQRSFLLESYANDIESAWKLDEIDLREEDAMILLNEYAATPSDKLTESAFALKKRLREIALESVKHEIAIESYRQKITNIVSSYMTYETFVRNKDLYYWCHVMMGLVLMCGEDDGGQDMLRQISRYCTDNGNKNGNKEVRECAEKILAVVGEGMLELFGLHD